MYFPSEELLHFLSRSDRIARRATKASRKFKRLERYNEIKNALSDLFQEDESFFKVYFFGSRTIGISNYRSDLDIYVDWDDNFMYGSSHQAIQEQLRWVTEEMRRNENWRITISLAHATVPILRCFYIPMRLSCEIAFSDGLGVINSDLLKHLFEIQPEAIKFFHCIRIWLCIVKFNLKRYQLTLLVIFFLQSRGFMPSIARVQKGLPRKCIKDTVVSFSKERTLEDYGCNRMKDYNRYVSRFFQFYLDFDFDNLVVFPNLGKAVRKLDYELHLPILTRICNDLSGFKWGKPMAVASTLTIDYNVTYDVGKDRLQRFLDMCSRSFILLENNPEFSR